MTEIALEAGFAHPSHMARCVRRVLGLSPSQLRSQGSYLASLDQTFIVCTASNLQLPSTAT